MLRSFYVALSLALNLAFVLTLLLACAGLSAAPAANAQSPAVSSDSNQGAVRRADQGARDALSQRLDTLQRFRAQFTQTVEGARGDVLERATGRLVLARPKFHWAVDAPYPQRIVAGDDKLSIYDPDLAQVIVRPLATALQDTPISVLTSHEVALADNFDVVLFAGGSAEEEDVFILTPRHNDSLYDEIRLHFLGADLTQLGILDHLGQFTAIRFAEVSHPAVIDSTEFTLELPADVDVIEG